MGQSAGSAVAISYKVESTNGITPTDTVGGGGSTTLNGAVNPGAVQIVVNSATNIAVNDVLKVGTGDNVDYVKVSSIASAPTLDIDADTKINFRHEDAEAVLEVDPTTDWVQLGNVVSFEPTGGRGLFVSQALTGNRIVSNTRAGNYDSGATMQVEVGIEGLGVFLADALSTTVGTVGTTTAGASTTLSAAASAGDATVSVTSETGFATGEYAQIGTGDSAETIKIGSTGVGTLTLDTTVHPYGLRQAHANGVACDEVVSPFTHTIKRGSSIPAGISFKLDMTDNNLVGLSRGNKISQVVVNADPTQGIATLDITLQGKAMNIYSEDIFGTPTAVSHTPYAHWELDIQVDDVSLTTNKLESMSLTIENALSAPPVLGQAFPSAITPGEGSLSGTMTSQFESLDFANRIVADTSTKLEFIWTYITDTNHTLEFEIPVAKFSGTPFPGVASKDPITTQYSYTGVDDGNQNDIIITLKSTQPELRIPLD